MSNSAGIPQINLLYESPDGKNGFALKQHDRGRYEKDVLTLAKMSDFSSYFQNSRKMTETQSGGKTFYLKISDAKSQTAFGEQKYTAAAAFLTNDSVVELDYYGDKFLSQDELIKIILSLKAL